MKNFVIRFVDFLNQNQTKSILVCDTSKEAIIKRFELIINAKRKEECYWDGKTNDVLIYVIELSEPGVEMLNANDLQKFVHHLCCAWY